MSERLPMEYVLPLRRTDGRGQDELVGYLRMLDQWVDVTVVDGSADDLFHGLGEALAGTGVRQVPPSVAGANGKARGAVTGMRAARHDLVIIADDDVRYTRSELEEVQARLAAADLIRVQNRYEPLPWQARWDTGRTLLNRAFGGDYGGTLALRLSALGAQPGYRTDVLFENLELERTMRAAGGRVVVPLDLVVRRLPPSVNHFRGQRVRQAYDDFAQPARLLLEAALLPLALWAVARRGVAALAASAAAVVAVAEYGRHRGGGTRWFGFSASLCAPLWAGERAITIWLAILQRLRGGVRYGEGRLRTAASSLRELTRRAGAQEEETDVD